MSRSQTETILVVSHIRKEREQLCGVLRAAGHGVRVAASAEEGLEAYETEAAALVVIDRDLPDKDGLVFTGLLRARDTEAVVVVVCGADVEDAVALMKEGAFHVLARPVLPEQLCVVALKALEHGRLSRGNKDLRQQLDISEKLAMIGRLASGVAHELNNPLDGVQRYIRMTRESLEEQVELKEYLDRAMSGLGRMAGIVRQLLTFSRNVVIENEAESLRTMLDEVVRTLAPSGSGAASVELHNPYLDLQVPRALFQVFVNLLKNALDSVEDLGPRGTVSITVTRDPVDVAIVVRDNGAGIAAHDLRRVFEPFFTTKEVGKGTGLGLPISARIVERCRGKISIECEPGAGCAVSVRLPAVAVVTTAPQALHGVQQG